MHVACALTFLMRDALSCFLRVTYDIYKDLFEVLTKYFKKISKIQSLQDSIYTTRMVSISLLEGKSTVKS